MLFDTIKLAIALSLSFFTDCFFIQYYGEIFAPFTFCFCLVTFIYQFSPLWWCTALLLLGLESFLLYDLFGLNFLFLIPLFILIKFGSGYLHSRKILTYCSLAGHWLSEFIFLSLFTLDFALPLTYTIIKMSVTLTTIYFSLKWLPTAERGNRS